MTYLRPGVILCVVSVVLGGRATASPILDPGESQRGPESTHDLTVEQLEFLDSLTDSGWHLGWFKNHGPDVAPNELNGNDGLTHVLFPDGAISLIAPGQGLGLTDGNSPVVLGLDTADPVTAQATVVPEPASIFLLGSGLAAAVARKRRRSRR